MLRNKKYGMGGAVQSFSSPMLAQGMQGGLSGFGTSGLQTFAKGGRMSNVEMGRMKIKDWYKKNYKTDELGDELNPNTTFDDLFSAILNGDVYSAMGVHDSVVRERLFSKLSKIKGRYENYAYELYMKYGDKPLGSYAKGGEIIDQYEGRTPADIWNNLSKSQRQHFIYDHLEEISVYKNIKELPSSEVIKAYNSDWRGLDKDIKNRFANHIREGQYAKGGQIASIGDSGIITDKNSMFVGKMALITGDLGNMYEVRVGERTTIVKKNGIRIISDEYADGGQIYKLAEKMTDADFEKGYDTLTAKEKESVKSLIRLGDDKKLALATILAEKNNPRKASDDFYREAYHYADGGSLDEIKEGDYFKTSEGEIFFIEKINKKDKNYPYFVTKSKPTDLGEVISFIEFNRYLKNGFFEKINTKYAKGGQITHLPESRKVSKEDIEQFIRYVDSFYGKNGVYADKYEGFNSKAQIRKAVMTYLNNLSSQQTWGGGAGDSLDRERVAQILKPTSQHIYAKGGQTSTYEVHLEAVPNRDFDQSYHEAKVRVPKLKKSAKSVAEAVSIAKKFIQDNDLGGSNFLPAKLYKNGKQIGFISYNGRVWNNDQSEMKYAEGGEIGKDYIFVGNTMMNGEYKPVYKKDNKYYLKYYNPTKYNFLADEKDIKNYRIGRANDTYAKGGEVSDSLNKTEKYWYERIKNSHSKSVSTYNLSTNNIIILNRLSLMGLVDKQVIKGTQEATYTLKEKFAKGGEVSEKEIIKSGYFISPEFEREKAKKFPYNVTNREGTILYRAENKSDAIEWIKERTFAKGGELVQLPPKGELTNRDNLLLKYQKVGSNYEFYIYEPIVKKVSGYNQTKYVCKNSDCALKMNYKEFINYLYSELYLDDKKFAKGGKIGFEGLAKKVAKRYVGKKVSKEYQAEYGKTYDAKEAKEVGNKVAGKVYKQQVAKKKIVRKLQRKTK